ncbi:immune-associated nucleotide-binding protein 9-like [Phalaenopsis equestris]|uniref:immune-associated nucleotide-binding protein 9-like n=1 Tax=Phalaenopsis equestris TaxID=78828 RepID=UPI0009E4602C|nr:immune-associated nucleotide-binding protein 9-like [Phalaenopsis equestris]
MEDNLINLPEDWEGAPIYYNDVFLAVVGKGGSGKSSVANSILGKPAFISNATMQMTTRASKMKSATLKDGRHVHVIDTPGLVGLSAGSEFADREIMKCIDLAKDGLNAVLMVFAMHNRFTDEDEDAIRYIKTFFGDRIVDYLIIVLTGGDVHENTKQTLSEWINKVCPEPLKEVALCRQQKQKENKDYPESSTKHLSKRKEKLDSSYDDEFKDISEEVHCDLYEKLEKLETNLRQEKASRRKLEEDGRKSIQELQKAMEISDEKIRKLKAELESKCECVIL